MPFAMVGNVEAPSNQLVVDKSPCLLGSPTARADRRRKSRDGATCNCRILQ